MATASGRHTEEMDIRISAGRDVQGDPTHRFLDIQYTPFVQVSHGYDSKSPGRISKVDYKTSFDFAKKLYTFSVKF